MGTVKPEEFCSRERENGYSKAIKAGRHESVSGRSIIRFFSWMYEVVCTPRDLCGSVVELQDFQDLFDLWIRFQVRHASSSVRVSADYIGTLHGGRKRFLTSLRLASPKAGLYKYIACSHRENAGDIGHAI